MYKNCKILLSETIDNINEWQYYVHGLKDPVELIC